MTTGAFVQSWHKSPREILANAIKANPLASEKEIAESVWETFTSEGTYWRSLFEYWFANNYRALTIEVQTNRVAVLRRQRRQSARKGRKIAQTIIANLMDMKLSNGKRLRDATFSDFAKEAGWLKDLSKRGKPSQVVGKTLTETDLINIRMRNAA